MAKTPHRHAELIKAWADGALIEWRNPEGTRKEWQEAASPAWRHDLEYRVKPEPVVEEFYGYIAGMHGFPDLQQARDVAQATFVFKEWPHWTRKRGGQDNLKLTYIDGKLERAEVLTK